MIRPCNDADFDTIYAIINDAAQAYSGVIPADCWYVPYVSKGYLRQEIASGVRFWGWDEGGVLVGIMGIQDVQDVTLIRHAYVRTANRKGGIGGKLLGELRKLTARSVLIGTWAAATMGDRILREARFSDGHARGKRPLDEEVLVDFNTANRDFYGLGGRDVVREFNRQTVKFVVRRENNDSREVAKRNCRRAILDAEAAPR
jgi:hypothetical protein